MVYRVIHLTPFVNLPGLYLFGVGLFNEKVLESSDDSELIDQCLEGFKKAVRIAGGLDITVSSPFPAPAPIPNSFSSLYASLFYFMSVKVGRWAIQP